MKANENLPKLQKKAANLPLSPGVYLMRDAKNNIIYVGKAKKLKNRVSSYFRNTEKHTPKVAAMVAQVFDFDTIVAGSEYEALVLECSLIKQHTPKYNIKLKDAKGFTYIRITDEMYPRIRVEKNKKADGEYLGPYMSWSTAAEAVDLVNRIFALPTCNREFPKSFGKARPCLNHHLKLCCGLCQGKISLPDYAQRLSSATRLLRGGGSEVVEELTEKMITCSENLEFEKAALLRDQINGIKKMKERQNVLFEADKNADFIAMLRGEGLFCFSVLKVRGGRLTDKQDFLPKEEGEDIAVLMDFLATYYYQNEDIPPRIYTHTPTPEEDRTLLEQLLSANSGHAVTIRANPSGENEKLLQKAAVNAREALSLHTGKKDREFETLTRLAELLSLSAPPMRIECYDIANYGDRLIVAGMVVFERGLPCRSAYRKFRIEDLPAQDDYAAMREVLTRRFTEYKAVKKGFEILPDLVLLDGGEGHVNVGKEVLAEMGLDIPLFGMVKDNRHRTRAIAAGGGEIEIAATKDVFAFVTRMQDEVHRFATDFLRKRKKDKELQTSLTVIDGIGDAKAKKLLSAFGSLKKVAAADYETLLGVNGISKKDAAAICRFFGQTFPEEQKNNEI